MALTDTAVRSTKPGNKPFEVYDREGLFLLINPGGSKLWRWRYRFDGREKLMALGEYPVVSLGQARELHFEARKLLAGGVDPMAERKAEAEARQKELEEKQRESEIELRNDCTRVVGLVVYRQVTPTRRVVMNRLEADVFPVMQQRGRLHSDADDRGIS